MEWFGNIYGKVWYTAKLGTMGYGTVAEIWSPTMPDVFEGKPLGLEVEPIDLLYSGETLGVEVFWRPEDVMEVLEDV